ncbi:keratin, type 1 cytoskeletal 11 [Biomphalaria glabrata]|nr:keratin, type 1 cytoskeletal 11 [Biomphalaria glabrata]
MDLKKRLSDLDPELDGLGNDSERRVLSILEDRDKVIMLQQQQIERLKAELRRVTEEKDLLQARLDAVDGERTPVNSLERQSR